MAKAIIKVGKSIKSKTRKLDKINILLNSINIFITSVILLKLFGVI